MLETILDQLRTVDPAWIYLAVILFAFLENLFPPLPSDVVVIVGASLLASSTLSFIPVVLATSLASALGFMLMFAVGKYLGEKVVRKGKLRFITTAGLAKCESWFEKYGYGLIAANRFLPGTRSAISFASGMFEMRAGSTFGYALFSALLWNSLIIYFGMSLGANVELIDRSLAAYHQVILLLTAAALLIFLIRRVLKSRKEEQSK